jgi:hypothetical protein
MLEDDDIVVIIINDQYDLCSNDSLLMIPVRSLRPEGNQVRVTNFSNLDDWFSHSLFVVVGESNRIIY